MNCKLFNLLKRSTPLLSIFTGMMFITSFAYAGVDLVVNHSDSPDPVSAGGIVTYTISVSNNGDTDSPTSTLTVTIPATTTYVSDSSGDGVTCTGPVGSDLTCDFGALAGFPTNEEKSVAVQLLTTTQGIVTVGAVAATSGAGADDTPANNTDNETTTINKGANVALVKSASTLNAPSGSALTYSFAITNNGPDSATLLRIQDPIPAGFSLISLPSECSDSGGTIICDIDGPIANGDTLNIGSISGVITAAGSSTLTNAASIGLQPSAPFGTPNDPDTSDNSSTVDTTVTGGSDVKISKSRSVSGSILVGADFNFVLSPSYSGDNPADLTVTDSIPVNYTIDSGSFLASQNGWSCGLAGQDVTCTRALGGAGTGYNQAIGNITIPVTVASSGNNIINSATITTTSTDPVPGNNTATDGGVNLVDPTVNLGIGKTGPDPALVVTGVEFDFYVRVNNTGTTGFYGTATITDNIPANMTVNSYTLNGWSCAPAAPVVGPATITCSRTYTSGSQLGAGANSPYVIMTAETATDGNFTNSATVTTADCNLAECNDGDLDTYQVVSSVTLDSADVRVLKSVDPATVLAGDILTYTLEVVNDGPTTSTDVRLTDTFSNLINNSVGATGAGYIDAVTTNGTATLDSCNDSASGSTGRSLSCVYTSIPVCTASVDCPVVTVRVRPGGNGGARSNTANVISNGTADPDHSNDSATANNTVTPRADIAVAKAATPSSVAAGQNLTYVVTVSNNGPSRAEGVSMTDTLPHDVTFVSATPSTGTCGTTPTAETTTTGGNDSVVCAIGTINNGSQQTVTIIVRPNTVTRGTNITNSATAITTTLETDGPANTVNANNSASVDVGIIVPSLDLVLNKDDSVDPVAVGDQTIYTITVTNSGPSAAENVTVTDALPAAGLSFVSATSSSGSCPTQPAVGDDSGANVICNLGYLASSGQETVTITMQGKVKGVYTNTATVTSDETGLGFESAANNSVNELTTVRTKADMEVTSKVASPASVDLRENFTFTIKIKNITGAGLSEADNVEVSDTLPTDMELTGAPTVGAPISGSVTLSTCTGAAGDTSFTCSLGTVVTNTEVDITVPVQLVNVTTMPQTFTNSASVSTSSLDVDLGNNSNSGDVGVNSSSITGKVFRDFNNNGAVTAGDTGISGITITLSGTSFDGAAVNETATTDASGDFVFIGLPESDGTGYTIVEGAITETYLNDGTDTAGTGGGDAAAVNDQISGIVLGANTTETGYLFAEVPVARIGIAKRVLSGPTVQADGTFLTTFRLNIENFSLEQVNSIVVTDALNGVAPAFGTYVAGGAGASLNNGEYTIQTAPSGGCGGANAAFTGSGDTTVATVATLASTTSCTLDFAVRARPTAPLPAVQPSGGRYENQATISGTGALSGQNPSDTSDNGSNPDPTNNDSAGDAGESDPTPISPSYTSAIGIAKTIQGGITVEANESITVPIRLTVENLGDEPLNTIAITDSMSGVAPKFGTYVAGGAGASLSPGEYTIQAAPSGTCGGLNAGFDGDGTVAVASFASLAIAGSCSIDFTFRFMPLASTTYENQASISAVGDHTAGAVSDTSDNGTDPDPDGDGNANEAGENDPTPISYPRIGLAKRVVGSSTTNNDGTVTVPFSFVVTNLGGEVLNSVIVSDDLSGASPQFGSYVAGGSGATLAATEYTINSAPAFSGACTGGTLTPGYNGDGTPSMASITGFASGASCTILTTIRFRPGAPLPAGNNFTNQATVSATGAVSAIDITDLSDDGVSPDTDGDGIGNEAGENDPTLVNTTFTKQISLTKTFSVAQSINADGSINAPFRVKVLNSGTEPLITLTVTDNLEGVAPSFGTYVAGGAAATLNRGEYTIETAPAFNGACATGTLTAAYTGDAQDQLASLTRLEVLDSCEIDFTVRFLPTSPLPGGGYSNSGSTQGTGEFSGGAPVTDISQNGIDPDPNGNDDPTDDNDPTPVTTNHTASIGVAKALQGSLTVNGNDTYTGTFRIVVENLGNEELATVSVSDAMNTAPSNLGTFVAGGAGASLAAGQYTIESAPAFSGACTNGTANAAFNGEGDAVLATITEMDTETSCTVDYDFRFMPQASTSYLNRATAQGTGVYSTSVVTDQSDNGTDPDPSGNGDATEAGENDATPVPYPRIGLAKRVVGSSTTNANGTVTVPFSFVVTNLGGEDLTVSAITDDLSGASPQFGSYVAGGAAATLAATEYTIETAPAFSGACAGGTLTPGYDGDATPSLASISSFASGASCTITTTIRFRPGAPLPGGGNFTNQASVAATGDESGLAATDLSDDGVAPDTDGDGVGNEVGENDPTPIGTSFTPEISLTKTFSVAQSINADGTVNAPFRLKVLNSGTEPLVTLTVTDNLAGVAPAFGTYVAGGAAASLSRGEYTVQTAPAFNGACATGTLTAGYTGDAQDQLASLTRLEVLGSCEIDFTLRFRPTSPLPGGGYSNSGSAQGTGEFSGGAPVTDISQNGIDPDPNGNDDPTDDNDPTPVSPGHTASIGIAKELQNGLIIDANGSYSGTFSLVVENLGNEELQTVSVSDAMDTAPSNLGTFVAGGAGATLSAGQYTIEAAPAFNGACTNGTANAAFDGEGTPVVATITEMAIGATCTVEYDFRFVPEPGISYLNQATTQGTGAYSTTVATDQSDNGTDPDPSGNDDATEAGENDATPIPYPRIGLAKRLVGSTTTNADGSVLVPLSFVVTNLGGEDLSNVGISDDLSGASPQFGSYVAGGAGATLAATEYTIQTAPAFSGACATGTIDPAYDGDGNGSIASITSLTSGSSCTITMTLRFRPGAPLPAGGNYTNQAGVAATGASSAIDITDLSDDGADPDSDNDGVGNEPGENDPTTVNVSFTPRIALAKRVVGSETINANGTVTVPFRVVVSNNGTEPLTTITVSDDLSGVAPAFGTYVAGGAGATLDKGEYTIESAPAFNGACATGTLTAAYTGDAQAQLASLTRLEVLDSCEIDFTLRFKPTSPLPGGGYSNQATTSGTGELSGGAPVTDLSQDGLDPDPDGDDDATDNNVPTPVSPSHTASIGIAKTLLNGQILNSNGSYSGTFRLVVENLGDEELQTVSISDAMDTAPSNLGTFVAGGAGASLAAGQYTIESAPAFVGACTNGTANAAFNGEGTPVVASITELDTGTSCTVEYDFRFVPEPGINYFNQATTQGTGAYSASVVNDQSDNGSDPDPSGNGDATEAGENDATPIPYPRIGLAKRLVGSTTTNADGTVTAALSFVVTNLGGEDLSNVGISDDLSGASPQFGSYVAGGAAATLAATEYTIQTAPAFSGACATGTIDPAYDGDGNGSIASITSLTSGSSCTITMTLRFRPGAPLPAGGNFSNQAAVAATGASSAIDITDLSDDGTDPDTDNDGVGNEPGENDPTPINVSFTPQVGLTKAKTAAETINANGTVTVPFRLAVSNSGDEPLVTVSISDTLAGVAPAFGTYVAGGAAATLDKGEYTIETAPAFNGACATGTLTAAYDGDTQDELASLTRLEIAASCEIDFTLRFKPTSPLPAGGYSNQGSTQATGELSTTVVNDLSQNGIDPDPSGNDDPTDDNDPTPVNTSHSSAIGIAKSLQNGQILNSNGSYSGTFRLVVENLGNEELQTVSITDAMNSAPSNLGTFVAGGAAATLAAGQYTIESAPAFVGACTNGTANAAFNGEATPVVATISELDTGTSCTVEYGFRFVPQPGLNYFNQATTQGTGAYSAGVVNDTSDDGTDPDTDGDMDATEAGENDPTPIPYPRIGLAKRLVGSTTTNTDGTVTAALSFVVTNLGGETLNTVAISDDLSGASPQFGSYVAGGAGATLAATEYTIQSAPAFSGACATGTIDPAYDGDGNATIANITTLSSGASCTITMTLRFRPGAPLPAGGNFSNQATVAATGASSAIDITDFSDDGTDPDSDNDGVGNEAGENDPTPINVTFTPQIGLTKRLTAAETTNANGTITVPFRLAVSNSGDEPLLAVAISDTLTGVAPAFGTYVAGGAAADLDKGEYTIETAPAFNGACANGTITAGYTGDAQAQLASLTRLEIAASCEIDFTLRFKPTSPLPAGGYSNQGSTQATGELSTTVVNDLSQDGANPDPSGNDDPTDDNDPTPVSTVHSAAIGIAKTLNSGLVVNSNGSYSGTFRMVVENLGNEELQSISITDAMNSAPSNLGTFVAGGAGATLAAGEYTIESAPAFVGACSNGTANAAYNGEATPVVATISELDTGSSCTIDFGFRFVPQPGSTYLNQATAQGSGAYSTVVVNDLSDDGTDPDPSGNDDATEAGENDPTPVPIPRIGLAKSAAAVTNNGDGTYDVPFTLTLINAGELALSNIQITDDLSEFGSYTSAAIPTAGQYTISSDPVQANPVNGAALTPVAAGVFTGTTGGENLLDAASSQLPNFGSGSESTAQINFTVRFFPTTAGPFNNSAVTTGTSSSGGNVTDDSVSGDTPDADGNGDPGDDTSPTVVSLSGQNIGVAKAVSGIVQTGIKSYTIPYTLIIANLDAVTTLTNVQLTDNLAATFPTAQSMSISTPAAVSACTGTVLNVASPAFNGVSQANLLAGNQNLQPGEECTVTFTVAIAFGSNPLPSVVQNNSATATAAETPGGVLIAADLSDNGSDPDSDDNGYAGDSGESDPTPVDFSSGSLSSVSGKIWQDINHDRIDNDNSSTPLPSFIVEVINSAGTILGTATSNEAGEYSVGGLFPSTNGDPATHYKVRFRESESGAVYGNPLSQDPVNPNGTIVDGHIAELELVTGTNTVQQDLPLDPSGVIYDSVTRNPVPDATVVINGPAGFDPALHLVGGAGNQTQVTGANGFYQYILLAGAPDGTYTLDVTPPPAYVPTPSAIIPGCTNTPTVVAVPSPALVYNDAAPPVLGTTIHDPATCPATSAGFAASADTTQYYYSFDLTIGTSGDVVNNHIPVDPVLGGAITLVKSTPLVNVSVGQLVPYTITATNTLAANLSNIDVRDIMPPGFKYKSGSATVDGVTTAPAINGRVLTWADLVFPANGSRSIKLLLVVGSGVQPGEYVNQARAFNNLVPEPDNAVSNLATATVRVVPDPVFDCSDLIGKVFDDQNANGYQDEGEPPLPNVRLATVRGLLVTTDAEGRFHVTCAMVPNELRGSNFIMKLDERTLPSGYRLTTENPRVVHLTRGKMSKLNFGAAIHRVVRLELTDPAFVAQQADPSPELALALDGLPQQLSAAPSVIRLAYNRNNETDDLIEDRLEMVRERIEKLWEEQGCCYDLVFEEEIFQRNLKAEGGAQ